ncbi:MAG: peptidoglycan-binding protein [bacterium]|nr:peptidoglycan-binding protein [bacterium]
MFPDAYYPYAKPTLTTFTCNEVRVQGRNLYSGYDTFGWVEGKTYAYARLPTNETYSLKVRLKDGATIPAGAFFGFGTGDYNTGAVTWLVQSGKIMTEQATSITSQHYLVCHPKTVCVSMEDYLEISLVRGSTPELLPYRMERMDISALTAKYFPDGMRPWTHWYALPFIDYGDALKSAPVHTPDTPATEYTLGSRSLEKGAKGTDVKTMQELLLQLGFSLPKYGADGSFGTETLSALKAFQSKAGIKADGIYGTETYAALMAATADRDEALKPSEPEDGDEKPDTTGRKVSISCVSGTVNIRTGNGTQYSRVTAAKNGDTFAWVATAGNGWHAVVVNGCVGWVSGKYSKAE